MGPVAPACAVAIALLYGAGCTLSSDDPPAADGGTGRDDGGAGEPDGGDGDGIPARGGDSYVMLDNGSTMSARFWADATGPGSCAREEVAGCTLSRCEDLPDAPRPHAGAIHVEAGADRGVLEPDGEGHYGVVSGEGAVSWTADQQIHIDAAGGDVPAFELALAGPASIEEVLAPPWDTGDLLVVSRDEPLAFEWTGADEQVAAFVLCRPEDSVRLQVGCALPPGSRSGSIPPEALSRLPAACPEALVAMATENRHYLEVGDYLVKILARGGQLARDAVLE